jgi:hypothetical protein
VCNLLSNEVSFFAVIILVRGLSKHVTRRIYDVDATHLKQIQRFFGEMVGEVWVVCHVGRLGGGEFDLW